MTLMTKSSRRCGNALSAGACFARKPALIFDLGGKSRQSFNEAACRRATRAEEKPAKASSRLTCSPKRSCEQPYRRFAERASNPS